jgi:hypothetical protein
LATMKTPRIAEGGKRQRSPVVLFPVGEARPLRKVVRAVLQNVNRAGRPAL